MGADLRVAIGQSPAYLADIRERLEWLRRILPDIVERGAELLFLPELFATGYNIGEAIETRAEAADGATAREIAGLAREFGLAIHYGFVEAKGEVIYNSAQCFSPQGERLGGHRKLVIPPGFEQEYFTSGVGCEIFVFKNFRIGTLICYDAEFAESARYVASFGAELILVPTALGAQWEWVSRIMIPTRAFENGVYLAYANHAGVENGMEYLGQSFIAAPNGQELVRAGEKPEIIYGDLSRDEVQKAQARLPYLKDREALSQEILGLGDEWL